MEGDSILKEIPSPFKVYENNEYVATELPPDLICLARSKDEPEVIKHATKPVYGFQFHPEMFVNETDGEKLLQNFLFNVLIS